MEIFTNKSPMVLFLGPFKMFPKKIERFFFFFTSIKYPFLVSKNWGSPKGNNRDGGVTFGDHRFPTTLMNFGFIPKIQKYPTMM